LFAAYALVAVAEIIMARNNVNGRRIRNMHLSPMYVLSLISAMMKNMRNGKKKASALMAEERNRYEKGRSRSSVLSLSHSRHDVLCPFG
jgi:hypothetical protein